MNKLYISIILILAIPLNGCSYCSIRHAGDPGTVCIAGHPHHVCDQRPKPAATTVHKGFFEQLSELILRLRSKETYDIIVNGQYQ